MPEELLTTVQLAKALQVTDQHLYRSLREPDCKIPFILVGKNKRFLLSEVIETLKNKGDE